MACLPNVLEHLQIPAPRGKARLHRLIPPSPRWSVASEPLHPRPPSDVNLGLFVLLCHAGSTPERRKVGWGSAIYDRRSHLLCFPLQR